MRTNSRSLANDYIVRQLVRSLVNLSRLATTMPRMRRAGRRIAASLACGFAAGFITGSGAEPQEALAEPRKGKSETRVIQTDDYYWLVGKWDIVTNESRVVGPEFPMASFRVYKPYAQPEDLDITNVTNRCIAAEFLRGRPGGRLRVDTDLWGLRITTNQLIAGTLPLPPPMLTYRHYRSGTNDFLQVTHRWGSWTFKKTSDSAGQPQVPWTFPYHGKERAELERRYQQLRQKIRESKQ